MPFVSGFLRIRRRGAHPDHELPEIEEPVDPDYGIDEGGGEGGEPPTIWPSPGRPTHPIALPKPPPGIWPPPTPAHPIVPIPPENGDGPHPEHPIELPPGSVWPRPPGTPSGKFVVLAWIPGYGYKYIVVDPSTWPHPEHPIEGGPAGGGSGRPPVRPTPTKT